MDIVNLQLFSIVDRNNLDFLRTYYTSGRGYMNYGIDNLAPQNIVEMTLKSSIHNAIINTKLRYAFGEGLLTDIKANFYDNMNDIVKKILYDYILFGGFSLRVVRYKDHTSIYHIDFTKVRSGQANEYDEVTQYHVKNDWSLIRNSKNNTLVTFNAFNETFEEGESQILYYYDKTPSIDYYPVPDWIGARDAILVDYELNNYISNILKNSYFPRQLIKLKQEFTEENSRKLISQLESCYKGTENAGKPIILSNMSKETPVEVDNLDFAIVDPEYKNLVSTNTDKIIQAHRIPRVLAGLEGSAGFSNNAEELKAAYEIFEKTVIIPYRQTIEKVLNKYLFTKEPIKIVPFDLITSTLSENALLQVLTVDEIRDMYGFEKLNKE